MPSSLCLTGMDNVGRAAARKHIMATNGGGSLTILNSGASMRVPGHVGSVCKQWPLSGLALVTLGEQFYSNCLI